MVMKS
jgi:Protein kinase domain